MSIQSNSAITLFGAPNERNLTVSEDLSRQGINLLRVSPCNVHITVLPDVHQPRYAMYKGLLPYYMHSAYEGRRVTTISPGYYTEPIEKHRLPIFFPDLACQFPITPSEESVMRMREIYFMKEARAGGRPIYLFPIDNKDRLVTLKNEFSPIETSPCISEAINIHAYRSLFTVNDIFSVFLAVHQYSAFKDREHFNNFQFETPLENQDDDDEEMDLPSYDRSTFATIGAHTIGEPSDEKPMAIRGRLIGDKNEAVTYVTSRDNVPSEAGRFFPFIPELALPDSETVPQIIDKYFLSSLGETADEIYEQMEDIRRAWGNMAKTRQGMVMSHLAKCIGIAIEGQSRALPIFGQRNIYRGTIILGYGWTMSIRNQIFEPRAPEVLRDALMIGDPHQVALATIINTTGATSERKQEMMQVQNMNALRVFLAGNWTRINTEISVKECGPRLSFGEVHWGINPQTITHALSLCGKSLVEINTMTNLPIHWSALMETDVVRIVWSCFGGMAPSFKIPTGRPMDLEKPTVSIKRGTQDVTIEVNKLAVRNVPLRQAYEDLEWVRREKKIMNPFGPGSQRASQNFQDRFFQGNDGKAVLVELRKFVGAVVTSVAGSSSLKRSSDDNGSSSTKRARHGF